MMMTLTYNTAIVLGGTMLLGANAGLVGTFAVLRRRALTGDALAHAALPGLCLAFLIVGQRNVPALLTGALVTGVLGVMTISFLRRMTRVKEDAAIGIVLSVFFGAGIVLSRLIQNLTTTGSKAGLDSYILGKTAGMVAQDVVWVGGLSLAVLVLLVVFYKEFQLVSFDPDFACSQGWPVGRLDLSLMGLIAATVVIGLPAVGVALMAALLIMPAAAARFWTDRLSSMLVLAAVLGGVIGAVGTMASASVSKLPAGPVLVLVGAVVFLASLLLGPKRGVIARMRRHLQFRREFAERSLLIQAATAVNIPPWGSTNRPWNGFTTEMVAETAGWPGSVVKQRLRQAERRGWLATTGDGRHEWTDSGQTRAAALLRGRALWKLFLLEMPDLAGSLADLGEESPEGVLPPELMAPLRAKLEAMQARAGQGSEP